MTAAVVGCGDISRYHLSAIERAPGVELAAVVDRDRRRAARLAGDRPGVGVWTDMGEMLEAVRPDAVHVVTPPATHAGLALAAMEAGCHVLVEKPMALDVREADAMMAAAQRSGVHLSTCHNYLFKPSITRARQLVASGAIGRVVHVSAFYGIAGERSSYAGQGTGSHWAWRLPGGVFTNFLPHLVYLVQEFLGGIDDVDAVALTPPPGPGTIPTELSALVRGPLASASLTVSMAAKPYMKFVEVYGTEATVRADLVRELCVVRRSSALPGGAAKVAASTSEAAQVVAGTAVSALKVISGGWRSMPGLHDLVDRFYASIREGTDPPVPASAGRAMVAVLEELRSRQPEAPEPAVIPIAEPETPAEERVRWSRALAGRVVVTGAAGFLGHHLALALRRCGADVVAVVRDRAGVPFDLDGQVEIVVGDLRDPSVLDAALAGASVVLHCAAATTNAAPWPVHEEDTVQATAAVLEGVRRCPTPPRIVHLSSVAVHGVDLPAGSVVDEATPVCSDVEPSAHYVRAKIGAERLATAAIEEGLPVVVVRLGTLYGPGRPPRVGLRRVGRALVTAGRGRNRLPFTWVGNAIDALLLAASEPEALGEVLTVVDEPQAKVCDVARLTDPRAVGVPVPTAVLLAVASLLERRRLARGVANPPRLSPYAVRSNARDIRYDTSKARKILGWEPWVSLADGVARSAGDA
jgi:predicted dehydrogenase/nucleoside-diphosphate-sugar epimerase